MTLKYAVSIAGSDSSGGAGLQTDIKTMNACGVWGMTVVAALTAQNGMQVTASAKVDSAFIAKQIRTLCDEFPVAAWKTGMLNTAETVHAVADALPADAVLVVDPVIVATSGGILLDEPGVSAVVEKLLSKAAVVTPNIPETEYLSGIRITDTASVEAAGQWFREQGAAAVLIKGGHSPAFAGADFLIDGDGFHTIAGRRLPFSDIHGTGCCLSSAIAAYLAQGKDVMSAVKQAKAFVASAIEHSVVYPSGRRTVNPLWVTVGKD
ncbi:MAG TPA: bifunctional hydroxymethylpyrimidine kinase/phosphomethylpyrimidine kinase [Methanocorpusculum sp.]|nr:bifunctional hydroxymethylpyrimidine kinase/phosphomethylpyrimidine kinase [Methanocorpusculum sp.]